MKKVLILVIIILLGVMCYNTISNGYQIAGLSVYGIGKIKDESKNLDDKISNVHQLEEVSYPAKLSELNTAAKNLRSTKKTYEELVVYSSEQEILNASQSERYNIEVLWTRVGNHATANNVITKMDLVSSLDNTPNANDLKFTSTGNYSDLTDFIRDIEDDDKLGFTIDEFEMVPVAGGNGSVLQATFRVKDVFINSDTITSNAQTTSSTNPENQDSNI
ncbi:MAG: hypothetical protein IJ223_00345 [Clostridia bacterium]|nr:hypothetical protein [Clostridia bacterium]